MLEFLVFINNFFFLGHKGGNIPGGGISPVAPPPLGAIVYNTLQVEFQQCILNTMDR